MIKNSAKINNTVPENVRLSHAYVAKPPIKSHRPSTGGGMTSRRMPFPQAPATGRLRYAHILKGGAE